MASTDTSDYYGVRQFERSQLNGTIGLAIFGRCHTLQCGAARAVNP